jgi:short-subunit dehydrogenase
MKKIIVLGALSEIAEAVCRLYAVEGASFLLAARNADRLHTVAHDLRTRGSGDVIVEALNLAQGDAGSLMSDWAARLNGVDLVLIAYGVLGDQRTLEKDLQAAAALIDTNFRSAAMWSLAAANLIESQNHGTLAVIGSVAGDRGRQSNYLYGATKGGLGILVQGLAHRLAASGGRAVLIKPGFVDTAMTAHVSNKGALWSSPQKIAKLIRNAVDGSSSEKYAPSYWRFIMMIIKAVPTAIFHRTKL